MSFSDQGEARFSIRGRAIFIGIAVATVFELRFADPVIVSRWLPFRASCGAITGLPCLFCGMTRAFHLLLRGNLSGALYFNWLAFPFLAAFGFLIALFVLEIVRRRRIFDLRKIVPLTIRQLTICAITAVALWALQVYLAISQHKTGLLNPRGPLYHVLVRS